MEKNIIKNVLCSYNEVLLAIQTVISVLSIPLINYKEFSVRKIMFVSM